MSEANGSVHSPPPGPLAVLESCSRDELLAIVAIVEALALEQRWASLYEFLFDRSPPPLDEAHATTPEQYQT
ncbi:hypothetical protein P3T21_000067 [Paraburkholderia sp. GAS334]